MSTLWVIFGMLAATFLPRLVPFLLPAARRPPAWLAHALGYVPAAALAALLVPGGFTAAGGSVGASVAALAVAAALSLRRINIGVTLAAAVGAAALVLVAG
jgi:branched-subunit amino acid transport protein